MRVATWNIQHGRPNPDGAPTLGPVVDGLRRLDADVVAVQELDSARRRSGGVDQPQALAEALEMEVRFAPTVRRDGEYGVGLLVRGRILDARTVALGGTREPRVLLCGEVEVDGHRWTIGSTHLSRRRAMATRQLLLAVDALAQLPPPRVLLGDLNLLPGEVLPWSTAEGYQLLDGPPTHSTRRRAPTRRIDHVLVSGARVTAAAVHRYAVSDHCAVQADLDPG